jgi:type II secretory pathway pseudopilin PulG
MIWLVCIPIAAMLVVVVVLWRRAVERADQLEALQLAHSFEREAIKEAEEKKRRLAELAAREQADLQNATDAELERRVNE